MDGRGSIKELFPTGKQLEPLVTPLADGKVGPGTGSQLTALVLTALATHPGIQSAWMTDAETH
jgi:hypothetical protein